MSKNLKKNQTGEISDGIGREIFYAVEGQKSCFIPVFKEKQKEQKTNVWAVRLTCVSRVIETVCSVLMSVSVLHCKCNVCAYVALHFQRLPCLNIMKSVCDSRDCENMSVL